MVDADVVMGENVTLYHPELSNIYGCTLGDDVEVGPFVEIQRGAIVGSGSKVCSHSFVCEGATIGMGVFIGHSVTFCNERMPLMGRTSTLTAPVVGNFASIGSGAVILPGVSVGFGAIVGAGAVLTMNVPKLAIVAGNPARVIRQFASMEERDAHV